MGTISPKDFLKNLSHLGCVAFGVMQCRGYITTTTTKETEVAEILKLKLVLLSKQKGWNKVKEKRLSKTESVLLKNFSLKQVSIVSVTEKS